MKKLATIIVATLAISTGAFAQGTLTFTTDQGGDGPFITDVDTTTRLNSGFSAELWAGPDANNLVAIAGAKQFGVFGGQVNAGANGIIADSSVSSAANVAGGATGVYQIRAFDNNGGTITSWQAAVNAGRSHSSATDGISLASVQFGGGSPPATPPFTENFAAFSLIPEPTTITLGLLGLGGLIASRRRKNA